MGCTLDFVNRGMISGKINVKGTMFAGEIRISQSKVLGNVPYYVLLNEEK